MGLPEEPDGLTLEELSARTGIEPRTLRSWVAEGLLSPPFRSGRGARYPSTNADRALAVRTLKDLHGLSLPEIGRRLMLASDEQIRRWAAELNPTLAPRGTARDYLRQIQADMPIRHTPAVLSKADLRLSFLSSSTGRRTKPGARPTSAPAEPGLRPNLAQLERLILRLEEVLEGPVAKRSRGTVWTHIPITPDFEFAIRGDLEPRERALFEQLADQFRAILTGRSSHD